MSIRSETSGSGCLDQRDDRSASRAAVRRAWRRAVMISMPKPGSIVSILSHSSRVSRLTSRTGWAVPTRIASSAIVDAMAKGDRAGVAPRPFALRAARRAARPACRYSGRWSRRRRSARRKRGEPRSDPGGRMGSIGSLSWPNAWSSRRPSSGPKRNVSGARGCCEEIARCARSRAGADRRRSSVRQPQRRDRQAARIAARHAPGGTMSDRPRGDNAQAHARRPRCRRSPHARQCQRRGEPPDQIRPAWPLRRHADGRRR